MEQFVTRSEKVKQIIKGLELARSLYVSSIVIGDPHIGKKHLLSYLFPDVVVISGEDQEEVEESLKTNSELIITNFEKLKNYEALEFDSKRILATADYMGNKQAIDRMFAFIYMMPPLKEREEDIPYLKRLFLSQARQDLMIESLDIDIDTLPADLSDELRSLKRGIYRYLMMKTMNKSEIEEALYGYFSDRLEGNNGYKKHLEIYEKPLIEAGLKRYKSQLKLSDILGINRNTLRKKIYEHSID